MKIKQSGNTLIIQETPGFIWIFGSLFCFVGGAFIYGSLGGFTNFNTVSLWVLILTFVMGATAFSVGFWIIFNAPFTKIVIDRYTDTVTFTKSVLFKKQKNIYGFDQIKQFCLIEEKDDENNPIWYFSMEFTGGEIEKISVLPSHNENFKRQFVFQSNQFMYKQIPSFRDAFEPGDES